MIIYKKIRRYNFCTTLEKDIQSRGWNKDKTSVITGPWKKHINQVNGFTVYAVDGEWVRNNLSVLYGHGGHGLVHEFIPLNEIWISTHHYNNSSYDCGCARNKGGKVTAKFFHDVVKHEIAEFKEMEEGTPFWKAHQIASKKEKEESHPITYENKI
jgi:hypothetical protein